MITEIEHEAMLHSLTVAHDLVENGGTFRVEHPGRAAGHIQSAIDTLLRAAPSGAAVAYAVAALRGRAA